MDLKVCPQSFLPASELVSVMQPMQFSMAQSWSRHSPFKSLPRAPIALRLKFKSFQVASDGGLQYLTTKNTELPVKCEFQINNKYFASVSVSWDIFETY